MHTKTSDMATVHETTKDDANPAHAHVISGLSLPPVYVDKEDGDCDPSAAPTAAESSDILIPVSSPDRVCLYYVGVFLLVFGFIALTTAVAMYLLPVTCSVHGCANDRATLMCCVTTNANHSHYTCSPEPARGNVTGCAAWHDTPLLSPVECDAWACNYNGTTGGSHRTDYKAYVDDTLDKGDLTVMLIVCTQLVVAGFVFKYMGCRLSNCMWRMRG